ncbi:MAG: phage recombination protein Bet [Desulfurellales bacterium]|nr:MAG: phage recombination protein Bet [Desulfurellales bacterium]
MAMLRTMVRLRSNVSLFCKEVKMSKAKQQQATADTVDAGLLDEILSSQAGREAVNEIVAKRIEIDSKQVFRYVPIGGNQEIVLTTERTLRVIAPAKNGERPPRLVIEEFNQTCAQLRLNPYMRDIYLIGYVPSRQDGQLKDVPATWSIVISIHSLQKRADENPEYDGLECGLVVEDEGQLRELMGAVRQDHQKLVGAWCKVYRKDRGRPTYVSVSLSEREKSFGEWKNQRAWMIVKCAKAAALREAFPRDMGGYPSKDEFDRANLLDQAIEKTEEKQRQPQASATSTAAALTRRTPLAEKDPIGKFKGELMAELRRADSPESLSGVIDRFRARAGGEVDKLDFLQAQLDRIKGITEVTVPVTPSLQDEEHGDAWEGEEDVAAIEEQIARES